ncbi:MAG TPA: FAD-dependent oxidoreductase [Xanthobacteraceae bacterium]|nr:FAD-dependent oxidoreductase [Xanthobacteraceae bacterium]
MLIDRRTFLMSSAAAVAAPALALAQTADVDVAIVGAGAAGIAAARRVAAANRSFRLIEASERIGGRCITDTRTFGRPFDRGAHWIYSPDANAVAQAGTRAGVDIYPAPPGQKVRVGRRYAREGEMEEFLATLVRARRAIEETTRRGDVSCAQALPKDLGSWQQTIEFLFGPSAFGKDLAALSALDFIKSAERDVAAFCRLGFGALLAKVGERVPVQLATPATRITWQGRSGVEIETARGKFSARTAIVTASTNMLASGRIAFAPELPRRQLDAAARLSLGSQDRVALELAGNPLGMQRDELMFEKSNDARTALLLANITGSTLCFVDVGGRFGRDLAAQGERAVVAFATDWLANLYGEDIRKAVGRSAATQWNMEPWVLGAASAAAPGGQGARRVLMEPLAARMWLAGEAAHETLWGTVAGAWESGERAATEALKAIGALKEPEKEKPAPQQRQRRKPRQRQPRQPAQPRF